MDYIQKYLKYKTKYLELKNQIGKGNTRHLYLKVVPEFANKTKDEFKSVTPRTLNVIQINDALDSTCSYESIAEKINSNRTRILVNDAQIKDFLSLLASKSNKIIEVDGFFNKYINYADKQDEGTYVEAKDNEKVFKEPVAQKTKNIEGKTITGFFATDGTGKKNLNQLMKCYKKVGIKYVMLEAAGGPGLVNLYKTYGLITILNGYNFYGMKATNTIMYGNIDNIITHTNQ